MAAAHYLQAGLGNGEWASFEFDVLPYIRRAIEPAYEGGYLQGTDPEDLAVSNMNLGWELPGTFDVGLNFRNLELTAVSE